MYKKIASVFALLFCSTLSAFAQSGVAVKQSGNVTPNTVPWWITSGVIGSGVTAVDSPISSFGATGPICSNSARQASGGWNSLCIQANQNGAATISLQNYGTAAPQSLVFNINGTAVGIPTVTLPTTTGDLACFSNTTGGLVDCGITPVAIENFGGSCSLADNTTALNAAANSVPGAVRVLFPNSCTYRFTQANAINFAKAVLLQGAAPRATVLDYEPNANGIFLNWSNGLSVIYAAGGAGLDNLTIISSNTAHTKTMVSFTDLSGFSATNSSIGWPAGGVTGGTGSICVYTHGREAITLRGLTLQCDKPLEIGLNPHAYLSVDVSHFSDLYLLPSATFPPVMVDPGVVFTDTTFDGYQAWVGGTGGFAYNDTAAFGVVSSVNAAGAGYTAGVPITLVGGTCTTAIQVLPLTVNGSGGVTSASIFNPGVCSISPASPVAAAAGGASFNLSLVAGFRLSFANVRSEGATSNSGYTFNIRPANTLQGLTITNSVLDSFACGVFLKNVLFGTIQQVNYLFGGGGCGVGVNATAANGNDMIRYIDNLWLAGVTQSVAGMVAVEKTDSPTGTSASVPPNALYSSSIVNETFSSITATTFNNVGITAPGSTANLSLGAGKNFAVGNTLTLNGVDGSTVDFGAGGTVIYGAGNQSWTPADASGAGLSLTTSVRYSTAGNMVFAYGRIAYPVTASGSVALVSGLPFGIQNQDYAPQCSVTKSNGGFNLGVAPVKNSATFNFVAAGGFATLTNTQMSNVTFDFMCTYPRT